MLTQTFPLLLSVLSQDLEIDFATVTDSGDRVAVLATRAITSNENWTELKKGELLAFHRGQPYNLDQLNEATSKGVEFI